MKLDLIRPVCEYEKDFLQDPFIVSYLNNIIDLKYNKNKSQYIDSDDKRESLLYAKIFKRMLEIFGFIKKQDKFKYSYGHHYANVRDMRISIKSFFWRYKYVFDIHCNYDNDRNARIEYISIECISDQGTGNFLKDVLQYIINENQNKKIKMPEIKIKDRKLIKSRSDLIDFN